MEKDKKKFSKRQEIAWEEPAEEEPWENVDGEWEENIAFGENADLEENPAGEENPAENLEAESEQDLDEGLDEDLDEELEDEEGFVLKPWMIPAFAGMLILAILICIPLWNLTHRDKDTVSVGTDAGVTMESVTDILAEGETASERIEETVAPTQEQGNGEAGTEAGSGAEAGAKAAGTDDGANAGVSTGTGAAVGTGAAEESQPVQEPISGNASMSFQETGDSVTAKDVTNLRSVPSTEDSENVVGQLKNGESLSRTGVNADTGWSRLVYNGETVYAVTQFLTTDLSYKTPTTAANPNRVSTLDGRVIIFADCDDYVTPKEYVNLRTEPSTSEGDSTVRSQIHNGENLHRTGYSPDSGWSRVEYNGEILYVVSSLVQGAAAE